MAILLQLYSCLVHGLKMYILFGFNPKIIFDTSSQVEFTHFYSQSEWIKGILCWTSSCSLMPIPLKL